MKTRTVLLALALFVVTLFTLKALAVPETLRLAKAESGKQKADISVLAVTPVLAQATPEETASAITTRIKDAVWPYLVKLALIVGTLRLLLKPVVEYLRAPPDERVVINWKSILNWLTSINVHPLKCLVLLSAFSFLILGTTGCFARVQVPANVVSFKTPRGELQLTHPQNTKAKDVSLFVSTNGEYSLSIGSLDTQNNPEVIDRSAAGQVAIMKEFGTQVREGIKTGVEAAGAAAK